MHFRTVRSLLPALLLLLPVLARGATSAAPQAGAAGPLNIILLIGDGMGPEQIKATSLYLYGKEGGLVMEGLPQRALVTTRSANDPVTDSAAAATALATGHKVNNNVVALALPGDGGKLTTLVEHFNAAGRLTGLITSNMLADATPAGFGAHAKDRKDYAEISRSMLTDVRPNLLAGGSANKDVTRGRVGGLDEEQARAAGYTVVTDRKGLSAWDDPKLRYVAGLFGEAALPGELDAQAQAKAGHPDPYATYPHLSEISLAALKFLARSPQGFFLMIEGAQIDPACHSWKLHRMVKEVVEFDRTVKVVLDWAKDRQDTLVIVTADHETGGLQIVKAGVSGALPEVKWTTGGHTGIPVPLFAWGVGAERFSGTLDNTAFFRLFTGREPYPSSALGAKAPARAAPAAP